MKILVLEYITGGGYADRPLPACLASEGEGMLRALLEDLLAIAGLQIDLLRDQRLPDLRLDSARVTMHRVTGPQEFTEKWHTLLQKTDAVWLIAPETGGILERSCADVLAAGKILLNCRPQAVHVTASKYATLRHLADYGVPVVPCYRCSELPSRMIGQWVIKPDDGVGCEGCRIVDRQTAEEVAGAQYASDLILQPFIEGIPASLSLLCHQGRAWILSVNQQLIHIENGFFSLAGCQAGVFGDSDGRLQKIAGMIAVALPKLWGYVGVDIILTDQDVKVLEVNPRLTVSYIGLHRILGCNPAQLVLDLVQGKTPAPLSGFHAVNETSFMREIA